jgi:hypothetical protein
MINLVGHRLARFPLDGLVWRRDLVYFEGPLLSEYSFNNDVYLKYWCDCDDDHNRWLFYKIKESDRLRLVAGEMSILDTINSHPDMFYLFSDENDVENIYNLCDKESIPEDYFPESDSFLDIKNYIEDDNIVSFIFEDEWAFEQLKIVYQKFTQIYDFIYSCTNSVRVNNSLPWHDGFSSMHFYNKLQAIIPISRRSKLEAIHYASPGYMKIHAKSDINSIILSKIKSFSERKAEIDELYSTLSGRIKALGLNQMIKSNATDAFNSDAVCLASLLKLKEQLEVGDHELNGFSSHGFDHCKILMAHYRRLDVFNNFIAERRIRVVSSLI